MRLGLMVSMVALLGWACGGVPTNVASFKQSQQPGDLEDVPLFYSFELPMVASPIHFRPDYDSGIDLSLESTPSRPDRPSVIRSLYNNSRGYRSEIRFDLYSGSLFVTQTQMGVTKQQELLAPRLARRGKDAYLATLDTLLKQVNAMRNGDGIDHKPVEELAAVVSYLQNVRSAAAGSVVAFDIKELFYPYELENLAETLSYQPDYDSRVLLTVDYLPIHSESTPVIQSYYDNSKGYQSKIVLLLASGVLRHESGAMNHISVVELPPPAQEPTAKIAYLNLLSQLAVQVQALQNGAGIRPEAHPELAKTTSYLEQVLRVIRSMQ